MKMTSLGSLKSLLHRFKYWVKRGCNNFGIEEFGNQLKARMYSLGEPDTSLSDFNTCKMVLSLTRARKDS